MGLIAGAPDLARLRELYTRLELRALLRNPWSTDGAAPPRRAAAAAARHGGVRHAAHRGVSGGDGGADSATAPRARDYRDDHLAETHWMLGSPSSRPRRSSPSIPRPTASITCRRASSGCRSRSRPGEAAYLPLGHDYPGAPPQLDRRPGARRHSNRCSRIAALPKLGHHLKFDTPCARELRHRASRAAL